MNNRSLLAGALAVCIGSSLGLAATDARACGGLFCDAGPMVGQMPVDQTGENILFVLEDGFIEAHVQIQYDPNTDASQFAWIVPVPTIPEFAVGSQQLLASVQNATTPAYGFRRFRETCDFGDEGGFFPGGDFCDGGAASSTSGGLSSGGDSAGEDGGETGGGTEVVLETSVGAFDIAVLSGGTADEVMTWLGDNGYVQDPAALPILQEYLDEGMMFAAFRLQNGVDVDEIHPISLRYQADTPMIPIRLTRIAVADDMDIRAFFLADGRVAPQNFAHVVPNILQLDWFGLGVNYKELISAAVDEANPEGHAFVTEFAGSTDAVLRDGIADSRWDGSAFAALDPALVTETLEAQGLLTCGDGACEYGHPLLLGLLQGFFPAPAGTSDAEFYGCTSCFSPAELAGWDPAGFSAAFTERVVDPAIHAEVLLDSYPALTRLYTTLSGPEMTADPAFHVNPDLDPDLSLTAEFGVLQLPCSGRPSMDLPDGREVFLPFNQTEWPQFPDPMPVIERVEQIGAAGPPMITQDNTALIAEQLELWNGAALALGPQASCHGEDDGGGGAGFLNGDGGCGCRSNGGGAGALALGILLLGMARRRRRRS